MQTEYKRPPAPTWEEKLFRKFEQQAHGETAYTEYQARQTATLENMQRLRALRLARDARRDKSD